MTPQELFLLSKVLGEQKEAEFQEKVTIAWLSEMYHRQEKLPSLQECLDDLKPKKQMTDDDMLEMVKKLNAQFGGTTEG